MADLFSWFRKDQVNNKFRWTWLEEKDEHTNIDQPGTVVVCDERIACKELE
jgi:hypothetical protein